MPDGTLTASTMTMQSAGPLAPHSGFGQNSTNGEFWTSEPAFGGENSTMVDFCPSKGGIA
jgi:hypothetical protein